jgi:hypothetical protein
MRLSALKGCFFHCNKQSIDDQSAGCLPVLTTAAT